MGRGGKVLLTLIAYPAIEIVVAIAVASIIGWYWVFIAFVIGMLIGLIIIRVSARRTGQSWAAAVREMRVRQEMGHEPLPQEASTAVPAQTALLIPAGALIAVPGFVTDIVGLIMLIPGVRSVIATRIARAVERRRLEG